MRCMIKGGGGGGEPYIVTVSFIGFIIHPADETSYCHATVPK